MKRRILILAIVSTVVAGTAIYLKLEDRNLPRGTSSEVNHRMVAILPLSGNLSVIGTPKREAMQLALEQAKQDYPVVNLEIEFQDSQGAAKEAITIVNKSTATDPPDSFFIDMTTIVDSCVPLINSSRTLTFAGSAQAGLTKRSEHLFRIFPGGDQEVELILSHLRERKPKGVFILHANELYGKSVKEELQRHTDEIPFSGFEEFAITDKDFKSQLAKAKASGADVIGLFGYGNEYGILIRQATEMGIPSSNIVANLGAVNIGVTQLPAELTEGMTFAGPAFALRAGTPSAPNEQTELEDAYRTKFGKAPDFRVAFIYDTIMLLAKSLNDGGNPYETLQNIDEYKGSSGMISITKTRDAHVELVLGKYENGQLVSLRK